jgi:nitrate reductase gamma subunit
MMASLNNFFFIALPYISIAVFLIGSIYRYKATGFKYSSLSAQFLEGKRGFWGTVPFHWGLLVVFLGHFTAFMFPKTTLLWNSHPVRLIILEVTGFIFGLCILFGLLNLLYRRLTHARIMAVTTRMDIAIELLILLQVIFGCWIALGYRWGSSWFAADLSPYLWSIFKFSPDLTAVSQLPFPIQLHIVGAFLIVLLIPFTRLVHFLVAPFHYIWRPYQKVVWYWNKKAIRDPNTAWSDKRPFNN